MQNQKKQIYLQHNQKKENIMILVKTKVDKGRLWTMKLKRCNGITEEYFKCKNNRLKKMIIITTKKHF